MLPLSRRSSIRRGLGAVGATAVAASLLAGCSTTPASTASSAPADAPHAFGHIHTLVPQEDGTVFVGTHAGLFRVSKDGSVEGPLGEYDFDVMGLAAADDVLIASGHPGPQTPPELGAPNLGIVTSDDDGESWKPVAFTGTEDFHVLVGGSGKQVFGIGSTKQAVRISADAGKTWTDGATIAAADLAVTKDGTVYAATQEGLLASDDDAATFDPAGDAPLLYSIDASGDDLVGVDTEGQLWRRKGTEWHELGKTEGVVAALGLAPSGVVYLVDDRGIVAFDGDSDTVILPVS